MDLVPTPPGSILILFTIQIRTLKCQILFRCFCYSSCTVFRSPLYLYFCRKVLRDFYKVGKHWISVWSIIFDEFQNTYFSKCTYIKSPKPPKKATKHGNWPQKSHAVQASNLRLILPKKYYWFPKITQWCEISMLHAHIFPWLLFGGKINIFIYVRFFNRLIIKY